MAKQLGTSLRRQVIAEAFSPLPRVLPYMYPKISALVPTFDCEGTYGGGTTSRGESEVVPRILSLFNKFNIHGTFNFVGKTAEEHEEIVKKLDKFNNDVWGHGYSHIYLNTSEKAQKEEVKRIAEVISKITNKPLEGWRSPYGVVNARLYEILQQNGIKYGSNWGTSTWGFLPFIPIINNKKFNITELPFDDSHFDAMVFRKLNLDLETILNLYKSKLLAHIKTLSIFTPLIHPVNLAEDDQREQMFLDFIDFATKQKNLWITSCSQVLSLYNELTNFEINKLNFTKNGNTHSFNLEVKRKNREQVKNQDTVANCVSLIYKISPIEKVDCSSEYQIIQLSNHEDVLCIPFDLTETHFSIRLTIQSERGNE